MPSIRSSENRILTHSGETDDGSAAGSERAPVPVSRNALRKTADQARSSSLTAEESRIRDTNRWRRRLLVRVRAVGATNARSLPQTPIVEASIACPVLRALRVEVCVLIERDGIRGMLVAEDVAAATAVMAPFEEAESLVASWGVAGRGCGVGLETSLVAIDHQHQQQ
jgi:hypothetical protein